MAGKVEKRSFVLLSKFGARRHESASKTATSHIRKPLALIKMKKQIEYGFWFWSHKLTGILNMLAELSKYELDEIEIQSIKQELTGTNDELGPWTNYRFEGQKFNLEFEFAYDAEEKSDMIHVKIKTEPALKEKLEALNLFQCLFKELEIEK